MMNWYCPACGAPNPGSGNHQEHSCNYCGYLLFSDAVVCPICGTVGSGELDNCRQCSQPLTTLGHVFERHETSGHSPPWIARSRQQAGRLKEVGLVESERRMEYFTSVEQQRISQIKQDELRQRDWDRRVLLAGASIVALIVLAVMGYALLKIATP